jgi:hypothetical protein
MTAFPPGLEPDRDLSPATWVEEALANWPRRRTFEVRDLVPPVFETYARILHRAWRPGDVREPTGTWSDLASARGVTLGPGTRWEELDQRHGGLWRVDEGSLSESEVGALVELLRAEGRTDARCWFGVWSGYATVDVGAAYLLARGTPMHRIANGVVRMRERIARSRARHAGARRAKFALLNGNRTYVLIGATVEDAVTLHHEFQYRTPNLWWPEDRSWFVHTEIDAMSTYLGGSRELIDRLVEEQVLESFQVGVDDEACL